MARAEVEKTKGMAEYATKEMAIIAKVVVETSSSSCTQNNACGCRVGHKGCDRGASSDLTNIGPRCPGARSQAHRLLQHWLFRSQSHVQAEAHTRMGPCNCSRVSYSSFRSLRGLLCGPLLCGRVLLFSVRLSGRGRAGLFLRYHRFHDHFGLCA